MVVTHVGPDGDALGSLTAVATALDQWSKTFTLVCDNPLPRRFDFLPFSDQIQQHPDTAVTYDLLIAVDCGDELRMGQAFADLSGERPFIINIDHHITNTQFGDINFIDAAATSTAEVLYRIFRGYDLELTAAMASSLLTGIVTDTLGFRTNNVTSQTMKIASELMDVGADLGAIMTQTMTVKPLSTIQLWQVGLNKMKIDNGLIWTSISNEEREAVGHNSTSTTGLVNLMADIEQAAIGIVLLEVDDGTVRIGFRCRPPYNVSEVALNLGGGGHALAAGCTLPGPLAKAESMVIALTKESLRQQEAILKNEY
ncbi:MAG: bifunctional oligoribonuclease/PAP phosphatase NrnA [Ardenticatenaceae bacterium]|nr:bifunctional oligoribonuclease/PAP phosphatase NrnA [Ardenticatenaceae bacterium]MCB9443813.1 bifunctional oligoribonuclease/PAP phosphatase NrnA [Ardenticatenaceae bacterium]